MENPPEKINGEKVVLSLRDGDTEGDEDITGSLQRGEKLEKPPDLMKGEKVASCLKDGQAEDGMYTPDSQGHREKIIDPPDLMNGIKGVSCLKDGKADVEIDTKYFTEKKRGKVVRTQYNHWTKEEISRDERFLHDNLTLKKSKKSIKIKELTLALAKKPG